MRTYKNLSKRILSIILTVIMLTGLVQFNVFASEEKELKILFTHDIHDYYYPTTTYDGEKYVEHGGAAKLTTIINEHSDENTLYLDAGDFSMGTLYQAAYNTDAVELRDLGRAGCTVTTFGNHEFDYGSEGIAQMLEAALASGEKLPYIVSSNIDMSGELDEEQSHFKEAMDSYGVRENVILECGGYKIGIFGLVGYDCIDCIQTDLSYIDYKESAAYQVDKLKNEGCDMIIALSHAGTSGDGVSGEDIELAKEVSGIDVVISGHTHTTYTEPIRVNDTVIVSAGEYLTNVGELVIAKNNGELTVKEYDLISVDSSVKEDEDTLKFQSQIKKIIQNGYLKDTGLDFDQVIAHSSDNMISLGEMHSTHQEYNIGDLIADSYMYEAEKNGIEDIDVAVVGLGTIRGSIKAGDVTLADAFEICSLGVGGDTSAGHPLVIAYISGKELKLMTELDASLGTLVSSIKMSYSGLEFTFNSKKLLLDRVTELYLVDDEGNREKIQNDKLYKVVANMYAFNMLGMLNGLTRGILSITPKNAEGVPMEDFYDYSMKDINGKEVKEWVAFADYLGSFEKGSLGVPEIPDRYFCSQGRKNRVEEGGIHALFPVGTASAIMPVVLGSVLLVLILIIVLICISVKKRRHKRKTPPFDETEQSTDINEKNDILKAELKDTGDSDREIEESQETGDSDKEIEGSQETVDSENKTEKPQETVDSENETEKSQETVDSENETEESPDTAKIKNENIEI